MATNKKDEELYGYEMTDEVSTGGKYLTFRKGDKGRTIQIRLVSKPKYVNQHWILGSDGKQSPIACKGEECPYCGKDVPPKEKMDRTAKWGWVVIDRADGEVKVFTGPTLIARKIRKLVENPNWGNPFLYDIEIRRDEAPGEGYYDVTPVPKGMGTEITAEEKANVEKAAFDLSKELEGSKESKHVGNYGAPDIIENAPADEGDEPEEGDDNEPIPF